MAEDVDQLLTAQEVAALLRVRSAYVYELARNRALPCVRIGRRIVRFRIEDVRSYIEQQHAPLAPATQREATVAWMGVFQKSRAAPTEPFRWRV